MLLQQRGLARPGPQRGLGSVTAHHGARLNSLPGPCLIGRARRQQHMRAAAGAAPPQQQHQPSAQPLGDVAVMGAGRLASQLVQSITNPKEDKQKKQREQRKQREAERQQQEEQEQEQQLLLEQQEAAAAAAAAADAAGDAAQQLAAEGAEAAAAAGEAAAAAVPEALASASSGAQLQQQLREAPSEYTDALEEEAAPRTLQQRAADARAFLASSGTGRAVGIAAGLFLGATLLIALYRSYEKFSSPRAQRKRMIDKNKLLVDELSQYLPGRRAELSAGVVKRLRGQTGFSPVEVFRKYLWFLLRERQFDAAAVEDMVALKSALALTDDQVAEALKERSQRIYDKYGTLMLNVDGMTAEGVERKATCRALFAKLLHLTEHEPLVAAGSEAFREADLRTIFGATDEDVDRLRIVSLYDVDLDAMDALASGGGGGGGSSSGSDIEQPGGGGGGAGQAAGSG